MVSRRGAVRCGAAPWLLDVGAPTTPILGGSGAGAGLFGGVKTNEVTAEQPLITLWLPRKVADVERHAIAQAAKAGAPATGGEEQRLADARLKPGVLFQVISS